MNATEYILAKQINWAVNRGLTLTGSKGVRGRPTYTRTLADNLFASLLPSVESDIRDGDGGELNGRADSPPKMHAVHSSSTMGVNIFQYWMAIGDVPAIATACGLCAGGNRHAKSIRFEFKCPISDQFRYAPNIDVVIENDETSPIRVLAVECKFSEAYSSRGHSGLAQKYLDLSSAWIDVPRLHELANTIKGDDATYTHLHAAQLVKHVLGLKAAYGKKGFRLLYLWYDALGCEGAKHRAEVEQFLDVAASDDLHVHAMTYQELIVGLATAYREHHPEYITYLSTRYL